jgi:aryl-alcohol dehydrogenase-like predicted oxidoreductase
LRWYHEVLGEIWQYTVLETGMKYVPLGNSGLIVSELCLGTMTWGSHNTAAEGHAQMSMALDHGVTFWDTAEMYPSNPVRVETFGDTETIIGTWFAKSGGRDRVILASKVSGGGQSVTKSPLISGLTLRAGVEGSLRRLQTDYIDLFQLHWPNRGDYHFRKIWNYAPPSDRESVTAHMIDVLETAATLVAEGKIRHLGLSNETVWGAARWLQLADSLGLPRMVSVQNEYSLLCRQFDSDWAELSAMENMPLLAFSPLAVGLLSGKYAGDVTPNGTRRSHTPDLSGRITPYVFEAVAAYMGIAARHRIDPCQMAIAWCLTRPFPIIPIIGATSESQLAANIAAADLTLSDEVMAAIGAVHRAFPAPY